MKNKLSYLFAALLFVAILESCSSGTNNHVYIERLGTDTMSAESFSRSSNGYKGRLLLRMPATQIATYNARLDKNGMISKMSIDWKTPSENPGGPKPRSYTVTFKDSMASMHLSGVWRGKNIDTTLQVAVPRGAVPVFGKFPLTTSTYTQIAEQARSTNSFPYSTDLIMPGSTRRLKATLSKLSGDTLSLNLFGYSYLATLDNQNRISWYSAQKTTVKTVTEPADNVNLEKLASRFAKLDAAGRGIAIASPMDSTLMTLDGAHLKIIYSRPSMRGRKIWGSLVPYDTVWRTGANAATQFSTDKDLIIGNTDVPAGNYTLYSIYTPDSAKLIINSQTGQWGTVYNESHDFARIPMDKSSTEPHEEFTISMDTADGTGYIRLAWDMTQYQVPVKVK